MDEATRLPVKTEKRAPVAAPAQWTPFESIRREIDRVFDRFHMGAWDFPFGRRAFEFEFPWPGVTGLAIAPAVDVVEKDKEYAITAELPGMDEKNIEIKFSNGTLTIKGEKKEEKEEREKDYFVSERRYGSFMRSFQVPEGVDILKWSVQLPADRIQVKVEKGWVTLSGTVPWQYQRLAAESAVRKLSGIRGVTNLIEIKPHVAASDVQRKITDSLKRNAEVEADSIRVVVDNDKVILEGKVKTWYERGLARRAAWSAPGVTMVEDRLTRG
jgi:HSP20 family protein